MAVIAKDVKTLLPDCDLDDSVVNAIISDATETVNSMLGDCSLMSDKEKEGVIKWFTAHMLASGPCRQVKREKLGDAEVEYDIQSGLDMSSTSYGRMALTLDRCGKLKTAGKKEVVIKAVTSFKYD